jgi:2-polyprenyl-3-methyl-5-hydroxy-6-metoxy-1,4-benzoquinol methylase
MVDAPCGDFYWLSTLNLESHLDSYRGFDIVPDLIEGNRQKWGSPKISFEVADLVKHAPPKADFILCRHVLIHLPFADCHRMLRNFQASGSEYLLVTNSP